MMTVRRFNSLLLLALLTVSGSSSTKVDGRAGEDVTLPCKYDFKKHGPTAVCWHRVSISLSGLVKEIITSCNKQIISTDGYKVRTRASNRYQLLERLEDGDVSLTILNTTEEDAGWYECRVEISGLFNDDTHHIYLTIEKGQLTVTTSSTSIDSEQQEAGGGVLVFMVRFLLAVIALATAGVATVIGRRWNQHKIPQQQQQQQTNTSVQFSSNSSAVELQVVQIDAGGNSDSV